MIAGTYRSRPLEAPRGLDTRPTSDRLRETLFNILAPRIEGARFADLFAGSGAVGIEAISRGAAFVWFAEKAPAALTAIRGNLSRLKISSGYAIEDRSIGKLLAAIAKKQMPVDIVFLDPPYEDETAYMDTLRQLAREQEELIAPGGIVVVEHRKKFDLPERVGALARYRLLKQGDAALSFYRVEGSEQREGE